MPIINVTPSKKDLPDYKLVRTEEVNTLVIPRQLRSGIKEILDGCGIEFTLESCMESGESYPAEVSFCGRVFDFDLYFLRGKFDPDSLKYAVENQYKTHRNII